MVKNKNDKTKVANLVEGDTFAVEIKSEKYKTYNGRYLLLIYSHSTKRTVAHFRAKLTEDKVLPKNKEEIEKLTYIKTMPYSHYKVKYRSKKEARKIKFDEYNMAYRYLFELYCPKYKTPDYFTYLGNYSHIKLPKNEVILIPMDLFCLDRTLIEDLIYEYKNWNLKESSIYTEKGCAIFHENSKRNEEILKEVLSKEYD